MARSRAVDGFHEDFAPIWTKTVKGCRFIGAHGEERNGGIAIREFMARHAAEIDPSLPFFYCQHEPPRNTCFGSWAWGRDDGRSTQALSPFPNAVAVSGHSHCSLTDERSVWQGAFTAVNAGYLFNTSAEYALRENGGFNRFGYKGERGVREHAMATFEPVALQGSLFSVYGDRLAIHRREFDTDQPLGEDWVLPLRASERSPYAYASRRNSRRMPRWSCARGRTQKARRRSRCRSRRRKRFGIAACSSTRSR